MADPVQAGIARAVAVAVLVATAAATGAVPAVGRGAAGVRAAEDVGRASVLADLAGEVLVLVGQVQAGEVLAVDEVLVVPGAEGAEAAEVAGQGATRRAGRSPSLARRRR